MTQRAVPLIMHLFLCGFAGLGSFENDTAYEEQWDSIAW
jgi:hypothetical protein